MELKFLKNEDLFQSNLEGNFPEICIGLLIDHKGILMSSFGINNSLNERLLASLVHTVSSYSDHLTSTLPDILCREQNQRYIKEKRNIHVNYLNADFYFSNFLNKKENQAYRIIFRILKKDVFSKSWIKEILIKIIEQLEQSDDLIEDSLNLFRNFNKFLLDELRLIENLEKFFTLRDLNFELIFRESGVFYGLIGDPIIKEIYKFTLKNLKNFKRTIININSKFYEIEKFYHNQQELYGLRISEHTE